jgi:hypothetical protein
MDRKSGWPKRVSFLGAALAAVLAITAVVWALFVDHELYDLRWKLRPGEVLRYRAVMLMGSPANMTHQVMVTRYTVTTVAPDGTVEVTSLLEEATIRKGGPEGLLVWDSASGAAVPKDYSVMATAAMVGVPVRCTADARGNLLSSDGIQAAQKRLKEMLGGDLFGAFTEVPFSGSGGMLQGAALPPAPVRKRARWKIEGSVGTPAWGQSRSTQEYSLTTIKKGIATIALIVSKLVETTPGEIAKAMNLKTPPDPTAKHGNEDETEFSLDEGVVVSQHGKHWTQGTTSRGMLFRFEVSSQTTLIERRPP